VNTARAVDGQLEEPRQPSAVRRIPGPAWAFIILAIFVAGLRVILGPLDFMPPEFWALRLVQLANAVATVLLGAALFIRRPDVWSACRPLGAAVVLFAVGPLLGTATPLLPLLSLRQVGPGPDPVMWAVAGVGPIAAVLDVAAVALLWMGIRRSRRRTGGRGSQRLAVAVWVIALFVLIGRLSAAIRISDASTSDAASLIAGVGLTTAYFVALTALTVTAVAGARAGERPRTAWWLAAASGLVVILGDLLAPIVDLIVREPVAIAVLVPSAVRLVSTLLLLSALALGLSSARGAGDDQRDAGAGERSSDLQPA
jgi:hypothetical protein